MFHIFRQYYRNIDKAESPPFLRFIPPRYIAAIILAAGSLMQPAPAARAEGYIGGAIESSTDILVDMDEPSQSQLRSTAELTLDAATYTDNLQTKVTASGTYDNKDSAPELRIDELFFLFYPLEYVRVAAGRFAYQPGSAELFSATNFFSGFNVESFIYQREQRYFSARDLLQASLFAGLFAGDFYLHLTASPFLPSLAIPDPSSRWFPSAHFPQSIDIAFPTDQTLTLDGIEVITADEEQFSLQSVSLMAEVGYSFRGADISFLYFRGWDPEFNAEVSINFPTGLYGGYIVKLTEKRNLIQAAGANVSSAFGPLRVWIDASYSSGKLLQTHSLSIFHLSSSLLPADYLRYTPGLSYEIPGTDILALLEYRGCLILRKEHSNLQYPLFSRLLAGIVQASLFESTLSFTLAALVSIEDGSFAILPKLQYKPCDALLFSVHSPFLFGRHDAEFGQFAENHLLSAKLTAYF